MHIKHAWAVSLAIVARVDRHREPRRRWGERVYNRCKACHSMTAGEHWVGPSLAGVVGRAAGAAKGFSYSDAMVGSGVVWDEAALDVYLADPAGFMLGNRMAFPGLEDAEARADVIAYITSAAR